MSAHASTRHRPLNEVDRLTLSLLIDKAAQFLLFIAGISAILFILSIIVFVFEQGLGFLLFLPYLPQGLFDALTKLAVRDLTICYEGKPVLSNVSLDVRENEIFGIIGPAGAAKTSFLKCLNRMDIFTQEMQVSGEIILDGVDVLKMRNVYEPDLLCLDEFSIAVDPVTTMRIEDVLKEIRSETTIILVTNLVQQARRLATRTAFFHEGFCVEVNDTEALFTGTVQDQRTRDYVEGRFG